MAAGERKIETPRHHADDDVRLALQVNLRAWHLWVSVEARLPRLVAQHCHVLLLLVFSLGENAPNQGCYAQRREDRRGHARGENSIGRAHAGKFIARVQVSAERRKRVRVPRVDHHLGPAYRTLVLLAPIRSCYLIAQRYQPIRLWKWKRAQQHAIYHREDHCARS